MGISDGCSGAVVGSTSVEVGCGAVVGSGCTVTVTGEGCSVVVDGSGIKDGSGTNVGSGATSEVVVGAGANRATSSSAFATSDSAALTRCFALATSVSSARRRRDSYHCRPASSASAAARRCWRLERFNCAS